jgi:pimeloyl-ACP methyl ester carboxylesterase
MLLSAKLFAATIVALAGYGASSQYFGTKNDEQRYLPIGQMVDIGGYSLHMVDSATCDLINLYNEDLTVACNSKFTVIMDAGFACNCLDWSLVQPEIARFARVISYDRAGYAWSDISPLDRTSKNIVYELHTMLHNAGIFGPYILVGHSFGGCNMQMYATQYPEDVAGLILVDSVHEDQVHVLRPPATHYFQLLTGAVYLGAFRLAAKIPVVSTMLKQQIAKLPEHVQEIYHSQSMTNKYADTLRAEAYFAPEDCRQLKEQAPSLADIPLMVISGGKPFINDQRAEHFYTPEQIAHVNEQWPILQANLAKKSARSSHLIAHESGHNIHVDQPKIIIDAVRQMIEQLS